jgi:hypothetical protein
MNFFGSTPPVDRKKEIKSPSPISFFLPRLFSTGASKESCRTITKGQRDIDKEIRAVERSEKELINNIRLAHKNGREVKINLCCAQNVAG